MRRAGEIFLRAVTRFALAGLAWAAATHGVLYGVEVFVIKQHALGASVAEVAVDHVVAFTAAAAILGIGASVAADRLWRRARNRGPAVPPS